MIGRVSGTLLEKMPPMALVDVAGIGYEIDVPMSSFYNLPAVGERVTLVTHFVVREDVQQLYGFLTQKERAAFRTLIRVAGVGPKLALTVLSGLSADELADCIMKKDVASLMRVPGIGKKTAERLLLELEGKLADALPQVAGTVAAKSNVANDALNTLLALGYSDKEVLPVLKKLPEDLSLEDSIRQALKLLARK
jgi:Holliday junction DNA helicase RuvA